MSHGHEPVFQVCKLVFYFNWIKKKQRVWKTILRLPWWKRGNITFCHVCVVDKHRFDRALMLTAKQTKKQVSRSHETIHPLTHRSSQESSVQRENSRPECRGQGVCRVNLKSVVPNVTFLSSSFWATSLHMSRFLEQIWLSSRHLEARLKDSSFFFVWRHPASAVRHSLQPGSRVTCSFSSVLSWACFKTEDKVKEVYTLEWAYQIFKSNFLKHFETI